MTSKVKGTEGIEFPDSTVQGSAAYTKAQSDTFKPGQVIQQLLYTDAGGSLPAIIGNVTTSTKNITPKSANSKILIAVSFYGSASSGGTFINTQIFENGSPVGAQNSHGLTAVGNQAVGGWTQQAIVSNTALTPREFLLWANNATGAGGAITNMVWTITEVQN